MIGITMNGATAAGQALQALGAQLRNPAPLIKILEREGRNRLVAHFRKRNTVPNKLGGRRTNYWLAVANSVTTSLNGKGLTISVTNPTFRQKVEGGTITPKRAKALAIPVNPLAHGVAPRVLEREMGVKIELIRAGTALGVLAAQLVPGSKELVVLYVLRSSVTQKADPEALPPKDEFQGAILSRARSYVARVTKNPRNTP